jgi:hypothetical protein
MTGSLIAQLEATLRQTVDEPHNLLVVTVKVLLWTICIISLVLSFRTALRTRSAR